MKFNKILVIICSFFSGIIYGQEIKSDSLYTFPVPNGWAAERFEIPISFASQISYKGIEDIRFTPGWAKATSDEYWSYAFLWYLQGNVTFDPSTIKKNMEAYYTGLMTNNGSNIPKEKLIPVLASFKETRTDDNDLKTYTGTIHMLDYMSQKPILLNCKVHVKNCQDKTKTSVFYEISPQPINHNIWLTLDTLWSNFKCK